MRPGEASAPRTQAERRSDAEAALLRAAAELVAERGTERASLRSIGARAGTSRAMPAYHFGSKDALIARLAERGQELTLAATMNGIDGVADGTDPPDALRELQLLIQTYLRLLAESAAPEERAVVVMWGATFPSESPVPAMVESDRRTHDLLTHLIRQGQAAGSMRADLPPDAVAVMVMGMARGVAAFGLTLPGAAQQDAVHQACRDAIVGALAPAPAPSPARGRRTQARHTLPEERVRGSLRTVS